MKSIKEYLSRIGKSRGFGIQSPWAYSFVRDVIMETLPYYSYEGIDANYPNDKERKKQKLFFRLRNFLKVKELHVINLDDVSFAGIVDFLKGNADCKAFVVEGLYSSGKNGRIWNELKSSELLGVTFDLYDFAICFLPNHLYKQHYKLNF